MTIFGTAADDNLVGTGGNNGFDVSQGGQDFVSGLGGDDLFFFGAAFTRNDEVHGGGGVADVLRLDGDYSAGVKFRAITMEAVEIIEVAAGNDYKLVMHDGNVAIGQTLTVDASALALGNLLVFGGANELDGVFHVTGGAGNDVVTGGGGADTFDLSLGGRDKLLGGGGNDNFSFGTAFTKNDKVDGGAGINTITLNGDYSLHLKAATIANIQTIAMFFGHDYEFVFDDANVAAGATLFVDGPSSANSLFANGSAETDGRFTFDGGGGDDVLIGGAGNDVFNILFAGNDFAEGGLGSDSFSSIFGNFGLGDHIDGGDGADNFTLGGDYSGGLNLTAAQMVSIESMSLTGAGSYKLAIADNVIAAGQALSVIANTGVGNTVRFDASAELDGSVTITGGADNDILIGGAVNDVLKGGLGADKLEGGGGSTGHLYTATAADSSGPGYDTIIGFDALADDSFDLFTFVSAVDAEITSGTLRKSDFDSDLGAAMSALASHHAVLFTPDAGNLAGSTFLVVDTNGTLGYQSGGDLVIEMDGMLNKAALDTTDF